VETLLWTYASWPTLVIRVVLGVIFFAHGARKVLGWFGGYGLKGTTRFLASLGIPLPVAYLVCLFELSLIHGRISSPPAGAPHPALSRVLRARECRQPLPGQLPRLVREPETLHAGLGAKHSYDFGIDALEAPEIEHHANSARPAGCRSRRRRPVLVLAPG
jgi:hypothetical protein